MVKIKAALVGAVIALVGLVSTVSAQDPVGGALATLAAATAQAQARQWQAAQQATAQAAALSSMATATAQAQDAQAQATRQALDLSAAATAAANAANSQATATRQAQEATRQAVDLEATRAAYALALNEKQERGRAGLVLLLAAGLLALVGCVYGLALLAWRKRAPLVTPIVCGGDVIDVAPLAMLPAGAAKAPGVRLVDDPSIIEAIGQWFYGEGDNE